MPEPSTEPPHLEPKPWKNGLKGLQFKKCNFVFSLSSYIKRQKILLLLLLVVTVVALVVVTDDGTAAAVVDIDAVFAVAPVYEFVVVVTATAVVDIDAVYAVLPLFMSLL